LDSSEWSNFDPSGLSEQSVTHAQQFTIPKRVVSFVYFDVDGENEYYLSCDDRIYVLI